MFAIAFGLLVSDALIACLLVRRWRAARRRILADGHAAEAAGRTARADAANDDLMVRQTAVRARQAAWPDAPAVPWRPRSGSSAGRPNGYAQLSQEADLLASPEALVYDPATWER